MKIIDNDPFESIVAEGIALKEYADVMCRALNATFSDQTGLRYFKVVDDDYCITAKDSSHE